MAGEPESLQLGSSLQVWETCRKAEDYFHRQSRPRKGKIALLKGNEMDAYR